jgi:hypothetical protein
MLKFAQFRRAFAGTAIAAVGFAVGQTLAAPIQLPPVDEPTLYWASQQYGRGVLERWTVQSEDRQVWALVSPRWPRLSYYQRYRFAVGMGRVAARKHYQFIAVDQIGQVVASYNCRALDASAELQSVPSDIPPCRLVLDPISGALFAPLIPPFGNESPTP